MIKTNGNDPVNALITEARDLDGATLPGITKREYFAAMALQGLLASGAGGHKDGKVLAAVEYADELIIQLNGENT